MAVLFSHINTSITVLPVIRLKDDLEGLNYLFESNLPCRVKATLIKTRWVSYGIGYASGV